MQYEQRGTLHKFVSEHYIVVFDESRGGSIVEWRLTSDPRNIVHREGCQTYLADNKTHFEQEYGGKADLKVEQTNEGYTISVMSRLADPYDINMKPSQVGAVYRLSANSNTIYKTFKICYDIDQKGYSWTHASQYICSPTGIFTQFKVDDLIVTIPSLISTNSGRVYFYFAKPHIMLYYYPYLKAELKVSDTIAVTCAAYLSETMNEMLFYINETKKPAVQGTILYTLSR